jgi:glycosyltransferase involved in cell wall biosynthesis
MDKLRLIIPVYNDWPSFRILLRELDKVAANLPIRMFVTAIDDGSTEDPDENFNNFADLRHIEGAEIVHLAGNVGHQRAIAIGLCVAVKGDDFDAVLIMDADGEDLPQMIEHLLMNIGQRKDFCIVAQRRKRTETPLFRLSYLFYKSVFKLVAGKTINFGNFCVLSRSYARRLVMVSDLWNHLPSAILRSRLPLTSVPIDRGRRYVDSSKMNFTSLVVHGLSGLSVYADTIFVRLLLLTVLLAVFGTISVGTVLTLRFFFPVHATPGWATTVTFGLTIILLQVFFTALSSILMLLNSRVQRLVIPIVDFKQYVGDRELLFGRRFAANNTTEPEEALIARSLS